MSFIYFSSILSLSLSTTIDLDIKHQVIQLLLYLMDSIYCIYFSGSSSWLSKTAFVCSDRDCVVRPEWLEPFEFGKFLHISSN